MIKKLLLPLLIMLVLGAKAEVKPKYMWFDCEANYKRLSYPDSIAYYLNKVKKTGFTDVVVDIKSIMGEVLYKSDYAPYMGEWKGITRAGNYDMLGIFIKEARKIGLRVHASMNVFSGGHNFHQRGIIYKEHPEWQSQVYWIDRIMPISEMTWNYNGMLNPANPEVRKYELDIIKEVVKKYKDLDGIVLDRVRYDGITSDFSELSKKAFEKYARVKVEKFPEDLIYWTKENGKDVWKPGKHFKKWVEWRSWVITSFMEEVRKEVKKINSHLLLGDYTGAWYPVYYELGVNWASRKYDPSRHYDWATPSYKKNGYAHLLDVYMTGLYYNEVTIEEVKQLNEANMKNRTEAAMGEGRDYWYSVEGGTQLAKEIVCGDVPVTGSIYVDQYNGNREQFKRAVKMALQKGDGLMLFDIVHIINRDWWDTLEEAIQESTK